LIHDWKRQSNEEIKKIINNTHGKYSIMLSGSREKGKKESKEKGLGLGMKDNKVSPLMMNK
jgi:hypothetical protein